MLICVQVVMDNASACTSAGRMLQAKYPHVTFTPCTAHCLDLLLEDIGKLAWAATTVKNAKLLVHYVTNHQLPLAEFRCGTATAAVTTGMLWRCADAQL